jgi:hypothetical protein
LLEIQPALPSRSVETSLSVLFNAMENGQIPPYAALSQGQRGELETMLADYEAWLRPATADEIRMDLLTLLAAFPRRPDDEDTRDIKVAVYSAALSDCPKWAVHRAVRAFISGKAGDRKWCPVAPQLAGECARYTLEYSTAVSRIRRALAAEVVGDVGTDERERVKAGFERLKADLGAGAKVQGWTPPEVARAEAEAALQKMLDDGPAPIGLSETLRSKIGAA